MLNLGSGEIRTCSGPSRRSLLTVGGVGWLGLSLPQVFAPPAAAAAKPRRERDLSCIFIFLNGGPSQFETFDPKPGQPAEIRGPYGAIETNVPGIRISELLPNLSRRMDKFCVLRGHTHGFDIHSAKHALTGKPGGGTSYGAVVSYARGFKTSVPPYFRLGNDMAGVTGGTLGPAFDPVRVPDPSTGKVVLPDYDLAVPAARFERRRSLLDQVEAVRREVDSDRLLRDRDSSYQRAVGILTSAEVRAAFDLGRERDSLRDAYGANKFGQSCLLARRLVEAGTRFVEIKWFGDFADESSAYDAWDIHGAELPGLSRMETQLCPRFDHGMATLLGDLHERGLLDTTLVVALGEFGRTPKINKWGGRDHWPACQSVFLAGAGVPGGTIIGESDLQGAYPASRPVTLPDLIVTLYRLLGLNANLDDRLRPFVGSGEPMPELIG
ncbi:MAG: hypothetical protein K0Q72_3600 [Armatimonadetes bacterium]|nr:hypothetical protein [Armatimonadota bacterium]